MTDCDSNFDPRIVADPYADICEPCETFDSANPFELAGTENPFVDCEDCETFDSADPYEDKNVTPFVDCEDIVITDPFNDCEDCVITNPYEDDSAPCPTFDDPYDSDCDISGIPYVTSDCGTFDFADPYEDKDVVPYVTCEGYSITCPYDDCDSCSCPWDSDARITNEYVEVLREGNPYVRITNEYTEILREGTPYVRLTNEYTEILREGTPYVRITQEYIEVLQKE